MLHAERRLEDLAARKHFEISVQGDRLANPSATNPGMAAGRRDRASASAAAAGSRRCSAHLKAPPLKLQLPLIQPGVPASASLSGHMFLVLFMPLHMTMSEEMKEWGHASGLLQEATRLPALLKPYLRVPLERVTLGVRLLSPAPLQLPPTLALLPGPSTGRVSCAVHASLPKVYGRLCSTALMNCQIGRATSHCTQPLQMYKYILVTFVRESRVSLYFFFVCAIYCA